MRYAHCHNYKTPSIVNREDLVDWRRAQMERSREHVRRKRKTLSGDVVRFHRSEMPSWKSSYPYPYHASSTWNGNRLMVTSIGYGFHFQNF